MISLGIDGDEHRLSFGDFSRLSKRFANVAREMGVGRGDRVMVLMGKVPEQHVILTELLKLGAIACPCPPQLRVEDLKFRAEHSGSVAIISECDRLRNHQVIPADLASLAGEDFCYLTTVGRVTGRPHIIETWFAIEGRTLYMLSGGRDRSDWVKNLLRNPEVAVQINSEHFDGRARIVEDPEEDELARRLLVEKYERNSGNLAHWRRTALPVAVDLAV